MLMSPQSSCATGVVSGGPATAQPCGPHERTAGFNVIGRGERACRRRVRPRRIAPTMAAMRGSPSGALVSGASASRGKRANVVAMTARLRSGKLSTSLARARAAALLKPSAATAGGRGRQPDGQRLGLIRCQTGQEGAIVETQFNAALRTAQGKDRQTRLRHGIDVAQNGAGVNLQLARQGRRCQAAAVLQQQKDLQKPRGAHDHT